MVDVNNKIAQTTQKIWHFIPKSLANFGDYPGDFRLQSVEWEIQSKIWSLPDYPGELTATSAARFLQQAKEPKSVTSFN